MYATCLCPHTTQLPVQAVTTAHPLHRVQFPRLQQAVSQQLIHNKHSKDINHIIDSCIRALAPRSYQSLTVRMTTRLTRDSHCLMAVGLLFLPSSQPSLRASLLGSCNGSTTSLAPRTIIKLVLGCHSRAFPPLLAPCTWATRLIWMGARVP